ncbi:MAG: hypothetical protein ABSD57_01205 [Verrucomicrobiota bacterium]|jgi:hypothetical protein
MKNELPSLTATAGNSYYGLAIGFTVTTMAFALGAFTFRFIHSDDI